jgi:hypothetical protein
MATQLQDLGGVSAVVAGVFCEHNDQIHSPLDLLATKAGPAAETGTGPDNISAVALERSQKQQGGSFVFVKKVRDICDRIC